MNITPEEIAKLKSSKSEKEWNAACDEIKSDRDGNYPPDWWKEVVQKGIMREVSASWN